MGKIKTTQRIFDIVKDIKDGKYMLPSIQRSFVWEQDRICKLMDSLVSDYPIGSFLVWKPPANLRIRTRDFVQDYRTGTRPLSEDRPLAHPPYLVLDGQQRFQSLFLAFFGSYDGKYLYFKLDSDPERGENGQSYEFQFLPPDQAALNSHWKLVREIAEISIPKISTFVDEKFKEDPDEVKERIKENLGKFIQVFNIEEKISMLEVKEELPYNDVLEVFVRVNSGGMILTKSDLVFSTIVLNIPEMERKFIELVDELNGRGEFEFDVDLIIKTSFVLLGKGAKYDVEKLKDKTFTDTLDEKFDSLRKSLLSTLEFLKTDAKLLSKRFLKSDLALIPIIDFIYQQPHNQLPEGQAAKLRQYLYMSFLMRLYSYGPDGKIDVIHKKILGNSFPLDEIGKYMTERTGLKYEFSKMMLNDLDLVLNIIQGGVAEIPQQRGWSLERDHIFPRSVLEGKGISGNLINNVGNFRLINKTRNILKRDKIPEENLEFFGSDDSEIKQIFQEARKDLTEEKFKKFVEKREELITGKVKDFLGFT